MAKREEYEHCIPDDHQDNIGQALCGRRIGTWKMGPYVNPTTGEIMEVKVLAASEFTFTNMDHWFLNARNGGRLVGCRACVAQILDHANTNQAILGELHGQ